MSVGKSAGKAEGEQGAVGEVDPKGFGVGVAGGGVKPNVTALSSTKRSKSRKSRDSAERSRAGTRKSTERRKSDSPAPSETSEKRLPTPPPKDDAFEEFKKERGSEINRILNENKGKHFSTVLFKNLSANSMSVQRMN